MAVLREPVCVSTFLPFLSFLRLRAGPRFNIVPASAFRLRLFVNLSRVETYSFGLDSQITFGQEQYD